MNTKNIPIFKDFGEFWHFTRNLPQKHMDIIFHALPQEEQVEIRHSYKQGGWDDLFKHNQINRLVDEIEETLSVNLIYVRCKVMSGKSYYMKKSDWNYIVNLFGPHDPKHYYYVLGDMEPEDVDKTTILLKRKKWEKNKR